MATHTDLRNARIRLETLADHLSTELIEADFVTVDLDMAVAKVRAAGDKVEDILEWIGDQS